MRVIDLALDGSPLDLPLLGPKAAGTFLRLPPTFYNLEYLSALLFGRTPAGATVLILLASVAAIAIFFFFARRIFPQSLALGLTALFSVSHFFVMYGRFSWNPNFLPFFILSGFLALLVSVDPSREERSRNRYFIAALVLLALATHFHFLAFLSLPVATVVFLTLKRPHFSLRTWALALSLALFTYFPVVLNEIKAGGTNTEQFLAAITEKSDKEDDHNFVEKFLRNASEQALHFTVITTGFEGADIPSFSLDERGFTWFCPERCDDGKPYGMAALVILFCGLLALVFEWYRSEASPKKDALLLVLIWFGTTFALFTPLAYSVAPRFFLLFGPFFPFVLGGLFLCLARSLRTSRTVSYFQWAVIISLIAANLTFLSERFDQLNRAALEPVENRPDRILKERVRVTLEQQENIVDFLEARQKETGYPIYMFSEPQYRRALKYLMEQRGIENDVLGFSGVYQEGLYYLIIRSQSNIESALDKYRASYAVGKRTFFGTLVAIELIPFQDKITGIRQDFSIPEKPARSLAPPRYTWREFFAADSTGSDEEDEPDISEEE